MGKDLRHVASWHNLHQPTQAEEGPWAGRVPSVSESVRVRGQGTMQLKADTFDIFQVRGFRS